jgi:hypothetical protein
MHCKVFAVFVATALAANLQFDWDCTRSLGTCNNACYAVNHGLAPGTLTYDTNVAKRNPRRTASGCNRTPLHQHRLQAIGRFLRRVPLRQRGGGWGGRHTLLR